MEGIGGFKVYKGLQRPLVFKNLKGKFIGWGAAALITSFLLCVLVGNLVGVLFGMVTLIVSFVLSMSFIQTESGTPQPGFGCGLLHRTTYSPG